MPDVSPPVIDQRVALALEALVTERPVVLTTASRQVVGRVFDITRSSYSPHVTVGVVEDLGRVHYARVTKHDADLAWRDA